MAGSDRSSGQIVFETILSRRSVRSGFTFEDVPTDVLENVVRCGLAAPSSKNAQPWRLHVVADRSCLAEIADDMDAASDGDRYVPHDPVTGRPLEGLVSTVGESAQVLREVSVGIFIENRGPFSGGRELLSSATPQARERAMFGYALEFAGLGAVVQNLWLAALELGLRGAFMGDVAIAESELRERLGLTGDLLGVLALGYAHSAPDEARQPREPYDGQLVTWRVAGDRA